MESIYVVIMGRVWEGLEYPCFVGTDEEKAIQAFKNVKKEVEFGFSSVSLLRYENNGDKNTELKISPTGWDDPDFIKKEKEDTKICN